MTARDRLMLVGMLALAIVAGGYLMVVAPERQKAAKLGAEVQTARQTLQSAQTQAAEAITAQSRYAIEYASLVSIGPAVPASGETPSLVYALASATNSRNVTFESIVSGSGSSPGSSSAHVTSAGAAFAQEPFSFGFTGNFVDLYKLIDQLESFTDQTSAGTLKVSGRLLTIDSVNLIRGESSSGPGGASSGKGRLKATVTATAYVLPPGQSALGGVTATGPAGATPAGATTSSPTSAAVIKAGP